MVQFVNLRKYPMCAKKMMEIDDGNFGRKAYVSLILMFELI